MVEGIVAVLGLALAIAQAGYATVAAEWGARIDARALSLARDIATRINKNNALKEKLTNAYNSRNAELVNSTLRGMGFGPRAAALYKQRMELEDAYHKEYNDLSERNVNLSAAQERANAAAMLAGSSHSGNKAAEQVVSGLEQNIKGGTV